MSSLSLACHECSRCSKLSVSFQLYLLFIHKMINYDLLVLSFDKELKKESVDISPMKESVAAAV